MFTILDRRHGSDASLRCVSLNTAVPPVEDCGTLVNKTKPKQSPRGAAGLTGADNYMWKGGRSISSHGYVLIRVGADHHLAAVNGYAYEHRVIAEKKLGRRLKNDELIHHLNGDRTDNRPDNLEIVLGVAGHKVCHRKKDSRLRLPGEPNPKVECACGCGGSFTLYDSSGRPRKLISGHNNRSPVLDSIREELSRSPSTTSGLAKALNLSPRSVSSCLSKKRNRGIFVRSGNLWRIVARGKDVPDGR